MRISQDKDSSLDTRAKKFEKYGIFNMFSKYRHVKGTKPGNGLYSKLIKESGAHFYIHFKKRILLTIVFVRIKIGVLGAFDV